MTNVIKCNHNPCAVYADRGILAHREQGYETDIKTPLTANLDSPVGKNKIVAMVLMIIRCPVGAHSPLLLNIGREYGACRCQILSVVACDKHPGVSLYMPP